MGKELARISILVFLLGIPCFSGCALIDQSKPRVGPNRLALSRFQGSLAGKSDLYHDKSNTSRDDPASNDDINKKVPVGKAWSMERPPTLAEVRETVKAGEAGDQLSQAGERWLYGHGLGTTMLNVGTVIVFPPYALYLLGNAGLALAGYEPVKVTDALPETPKEVVNDTFDGIVSVPGRFAALVSGEDFRERTKPTPSQP